MLSLLDRYEKRVEIKGGWRQFKPKKIVITSIFPPESMYKGTGEDQRQLLRRISLTTEIVPDVPEVTGVILNPVTIQSYDPPNPPYNVGNLDLLVLALCEAGGAAAPVVAKVLRS